MRIALLVTDLNPPRIGGISKVATEIVLSYCAQGHEVDVYCLARTVAAFPTQIQGLSLIEVKPNFKLYDEYPVMSFSISAFALLAKKHKQKPYDVSHAMNFNNYGLVLYRRALRKSGLAHVSTAFETTEMELKAKWHEFKKQPSVHCFAQIVMEMYLAPFQRAYIGWADAITTEDEETRANLLKKGIRSDDINLVPSGINLQEIDDYVTQHTQPQIANQNPQLQIAKGAPLILCPGRVDPRKGTQFILRAFARYFEKVPTAHLLLVGGGRGDYIGSIKKLIAELNISHQVTLTGRVDDMKPYYHACDLVVIPSLSEGIPITLQEAMAFSKPVICSKLQGTYAYANHLNSILWPEPASVDDLYQSLLTHKEKLTVEAVQQSRRFIEDYDWSGVAKNYLKVYEIARKKAALQS
ncbi:MAG: glycosyltransferase family 4 protein [Planctomycetes bacterium]|nr:glycosyltransferase family 4 protein [Planctomycetota bacterium]